MHRLSQNHALITQLWKIILYEAVSSFFSSYQLWALWFSCFFITCSEKHKWCFQPTRFACMPWISFEEALHFSAASPFVLTHTSCAWWRVMAFERCCQAAQISNVLSFRSGTRNCDLYLHHLWRIESTSRSLVMHHLKRSKEDLHRGAVFLCCAVHFTFIYTSIVHPSNTQNKTLLTLLDTFLSHSYF